MVDEAQVSAWYAKALAQGYGIATNNLAGMRFAQGDFEDARRFYQLARDQGFEHNTRGVVD